MITTTWTCDRCGHSQTTSEQMWDVTVGLKHVGLTHSGNPQHYTKMWCRECCEEFPQLLAPKPKPDAPPPAVPPPTIEDLIREIAEEAIEERLNQ